MSIKIFCDRQRCLPSLHKAEGFTLVELMVTIAIFAILVTLAAPSFDLLIRRSRLDAGAESFQSALAYTRSEATKRAARVSMLATGGLSGNFGNGWTIFTDDSGAPNAPGDCTLQSAGGEVLLRSQGPLASTVNLFIAQSEAGTPATFNCSARTPVPNACITYTADGHAEVTETSGVTNGGSFCLQDTSYPTMQRGITINFIGAYFLAKVTN
jgi:prepilin-type N-terminal cleavage/methylation domain-containing protein